MRTLILLSLLFCFLTSGCPEKKEVTFLPDNQIKGKWQSERTQIQYIVDSHSVYEQNISAETGNVYHFDDASVQVTYPDGTSVQGTYSVVKEAEEQKLVLQLPGTTTTYLLISVTPTHLVWQKDLENVHYYDGQAQKAAERAIYTQVFKRQ